MEENLDEMGFTPPAPEITQHCQNWNTNSWFSCDPPEGFDPTPWLRRPPPPPQDPFRDPHQQCILEEPPAGWNEVLPAPLHFNDQSISDAIYHPQAISSEAKERREAYQERVNQGLGDSANFRFPSNEMRAKAEAEAAAAAEANRAHLEAYFAGPCIFGKTGDPLPGELGYKEPWEILQENPTIGACKACKPDKSCSDSQASTLVYTPPESSIAGASVSGPTVLPSMESSSLSLGEIEASTGLKSTTRPRSQSEATMRTSWSSVTEHLEFYQPTPPTDEMVQLPQPAIQDSAAVEFEELPIDDYRCPNGWVYYTSGGIPIPASQAPSLAASGYVLYNSWGEPIAPFQYPTFPPLCYASDNGEDEPMPAPHDQDGSDNAPASHSGLRVVMPAPPNTPVSPADEARQRFTSQPYIMLAASSDSATPTHELHATIARQQTDINNLMGQADYISQQAAYESDMREKFVYQVHSLEYRIHYLVQQDIKMKHTLTEALHKCEDYKRAALEAHSSKNEVIKQKQQAVLKMTERMTNLEKECRRLRASLASQMASDKTATPPNAPPNTPVSPLSPKAPAPGASQSNSSGQHIHVQANPDDDVFGVESGQEGPIPGSQFLVLKKDLKVYTEHLNDCYTKVEAAVRRMPLVGIISRVNAGEEGVIAFLGLCQEYMMNRTEPFEMLSNPSEQYFLITGVVNRFFNDNVFFNGIMTQFRCMYRDEFIRRYTEEMDAATNERAQDFETRYMLAYKRAELAVVIVQQPGFWIFIQQFASQILDTIVSKVEKAFQPHCIRSLKEQLWPIVHDGLRVGIMMLQDPRTFEFWFPRLGVPWDSTFHLHRNSELVGEELSNERSPYVVRCTALPLVKVTDHNDPNPSPTVLHRAEVLVSNKKNKYRPQYSLGEESSRSNSRRHR